MNSTTPSETQATDPEVLFCNVCNQSVPDSALSCGKAIRLPSGVAPLVGGGGPTVRGGGPAAGFLIGGVVVLLAAMAATALFVDWRLEQSSRSSAQRVLSMDGRVEGIAQRMAMLDERLATSVAVSDLRPLRDLLDAVERSIPTEAQTTRAALDEALRPFGRLMTMVERIAETQVQHGARVALVQDDLRALGRDLADLRAQPRAASVLPGRAAEREVEAIVESGLPAELQHQVARLADVEAGTRFEAVDELLRSGDARIFEHVIPMAEDADPFVRRLVLEGLGTHRSKASVETLLAALADPESIVRHTAHASLRELTGQSLPFDPDARADQRTAMQRRWQKWWEDNAESF